jgi:hypothetical protein
MGMKCSRHLKLMGMNCQVSEANGLKCARHLKLMGMKCSRPLKMIRMKCQASEANGFEVLQASEDDGYELPGI